ncbi:MAG: hypothetical protein LBC18_12655 [Opitutaceae bacterium]|jgi:hypothetical protein|nr:hypothetical protein [Opitutaceae bacterium]
MFPTSASLRQRLLPIALGQAAGLACGVAGVRIATRLVAPGDYGAYGVFVSCAPLGMWVVHAGLVKFVVRHWAGSPDRAGLWRETIAAAWKKLPWLALAAGCAAAFVPGGPWRGTAGLLFLAAAALVPAALGQGALQAQRSHWADLGVAVTGSVTRSFGPPLCYVAAGGSLAALQAGFAAHALVFAGAAWWAASRAGRRAARAGAAPAATPAPAPAAAACVERPPGRQLTPVFAGPLFVVLALASWAATAANRWIMAGFFGAERAGFFTLAGNVSLIVTSMLGVVFVQYFQPSFFAAPAVTAAGRRALAGRVDRVAAGYLACALAGLGALHAAAPFLTGPLIAETYRGALGMIVPAGCFMAALLTAQFFHILLLAGRCERACGAVDLTGAAVLVGGGIAAAALGGETWFLRWLLVTPAIPWLLNRPMARKRLLAGPVENEGQN